MKIKLLIIVSVLCSCSSSSFYLGGANVLPCHDSWIKGIDGHSKVIELEDVEVEEIQSVLIDNEIACVHKLPNGSLVVVSLSSHGVPLANTFSIDNGNLKHEREELIINAN